MLKPTEQGTHVLRTLLTSKAYYPYVERKWFRGGGVAEADEKDMDMGFTDSECGESQPDFTIEEMLLYDAHKELQTEALKRSSELFLTDEGLEWVPDDDARHKEYVQEGYPAYSACLSSDEVINEAYCGTYGDAIQKKLKNVLKRALRRFIIQNEIGCGNWDY